MHVPSIYDSTQPTPVVFMLHGTSGDGEKFYNISGWKELGEVENIITVYPSSWHHCIVDEGVAKNTTKWHVFPGSFEYCAGEVPRDDIAFLRRIIEELNARFNVDARRMYLVGFSNGGQMAARCAVEMSDVFAAIVESAGSFTADTTYTPRRKLPVTFQIGNSDDKWLGSSSITAPMELFDTALANLAAFKRIVNTHTRTFGLGSTYTRSGDTSTALVATYQAQPVDPNLHFQFIFVKGLDHQYPNGINHPAKGAEVNWNWMKRFTLP